MLIKEGNELMAQNHGPKGDQKVYHTLEMHVEPLQERAEKIGDILGLSPEQRKLIAAAISYHDTTIEYDAPDPENVVGMVRRHRGAREGDQPMGEKGNEAVSADDMEKAMRQMNAEAGKDIFSEEQIKTGRWAIDATYPKADFGPDFKGAEFEKDPLYEQIIAHNPRVGKMIEFMRERGITKGPHFSQPHLEDPLIRGEKVPEEVIAVAVSDLGGFGMEDVQGSFGEGDREGKESFHNLRNPDTIARLMSDDKGKKKEDIIKDQEDRTKASNAILGWWGSQTGFGMWQMMRSTKLMYLLEKNGQLTPEKEAQFNSLLGHYEENLKAAAERHEAITAQFNEIKEADGDKKAFEYVAKEMKFV